MTLSATPSQRPVVGTRRGGVSRRRQPERGRNIRRRQGTFECLEARQLLAIDVTTLADSGPGSLRQAIDDLNTANVADTIVFRDLGVGTIAVATPLSAITNTNGTTFAFAGSTTAITLDGANAGGGPGLYIDGANSVSISGINLSIRNFDSGLSLHDSKGSSFKGLTLTNNSNGIQVLDGDFTGTVIQGNKITNNEAGIVLGTASFDGSTVSVTKLTIGGLTMGDGNTISRNSEDGIQVLSGNYAGTVIQGNTIFGNKDDGVQMGQLGNLIVDEGVVGLRLGGPTLAARNTIAFNKGNGIEVTEGEFTDTVIQGNNISSNTNYGIQLAPLPSASSPTAATLIGLSIGGSGLGQGNTIASNGLDGIAICGSFLGKADYSGTVVQGNSIRFNLFNGVSINAFAGGAPLIGFSIGGGTLGTGNEIAYNGFDGVQVNAGTYVLTAVQGNTIKLNGRHGVNFYAPFGQVLTGFGLGGVLPGQGNAISGNAASGLTASKGSYTLTTVAGNTISGNQIGISLFDTRNLTIGGPLAGHRNTVSDNTATGLAASGDLTGTTVMGNTFSTTSTTAEGVSLTNVNGLALGGADPGQANTLNGGVVGLVATGNMAGTTVAGNVFAGQSTGIRLQNAFGVLGQPFLIGGTTTSVGTGAGNQINAVTVGLYANGNMVQAVVSGNRITASGSGGNAMLLENATSLTVGGSLASQGNTLSAAQGNALAVTGESAGTVFYRNTVTASRYGALLTRARGFLFGNPNNRALGNIVQSNQVGVRAVGTSTGSQICWTTWSNNRVRLQRVGARGLVVRPRRG